MNELMNFNNELFGEIRFIDKDGKIYAVANDILKALGYAEGNWRTTLSRKCRKEGVAKCNVLTNGGNQKVNCIDEGNIYRLITGSKLPSAEKFETWVFDEVLPQIRKQGYYISKSITDEQVEKLESEVQDLKNKLHHERTQRLYNSNEIVKLINVDGLISSSLYKYLDSDLHLGEYKICKVNRRFTPNRDFTSRIVNEGYAKVSGKSIIFTEEFANRINSCPNALFKLKEINDLELQVRDRAIENRKPF